MDKRTLKSVVSEIRALDDLLADIPDGNIIERMSLEARLESVKSTLTGLPQQAAPKALHASRRGSTTMHPDERGLPA